MDNKLIKQHNAITTARYEMTALEKNIFYLLLAQLREEASVETKYELSVQDLKKIKGVRIRREELIQAAKKLIGRGLTLYDYDQKRFLTIGILTSAHYGKVKDKERLTVEFDPGLYPFLYDVKRRFTTFRLLTALNLKSKYAKRIYEMLSQFKDTSFLKISVQELKSRFGLIDPKTGKERYTEFGLFASKVLGVAQKELAEHTEISFTYKTKKTGKKITDLEFNITHQPLSNNTIQNKIYTSKNKLDAQSAPAEQPYTSPSLEKEALQQYIILTQELRWLAKKQAYKVVKNLPTQMLWNHIDKLKMAIRSGKGANPPAYFEDILKQRAQQGAYKADKQLAHLNEDQPSEAADSLLGAYCKKMVVEFGINMLIVSQIVTQVPFQSLQNTLDKISQELDEQAVENQAKYVIERLQKEFTLVLDT